MSERSELARPWAIALLAGLGVVGALAARRAAPRVVPLYRAAVELSIGAMEGPYRSMAQAGVIGAGVGALLKQMLADGTLARDFPGARGLTLAITPVMGQGIRITGELSDPDTLARALDLAARRVVSAADAERRAAAEKQTARPAGGAAKAPARTVENPDLVWGRHRLTAHLARRPQLPPAQVRRDSDDMIVELLERGAAAGRQGVRIQREMVKQVEPTIAAVTELWYVFPLAIAGPPSKPEAIRERSLLRPAVGGGMIGVGAGLLIVAAAAAVARAHRAALAARTIVVPSGEDAPESPPGNRKRR